jgi:hypothetical protein
MAAATTVSINDGQATPVAHSFVPARKNGNIVTWEERTTAHTPLGFFTISMSQSPATASSPVQRSKVQLVVPLESQDADTGIYSYDKVMRANIEVILPTTAVDAERDDMSAYVRNLAAHAVFRSMLEDSDPAY